MLWQVQEAKQRFSQLLRLAESEGPQTVTRHGEAVAVVVSAEEYERLTKPKMGFKEFLRSVPGHERARSDEAEGLSQRDRAVSYLLDTNVGLGRTQPSPDQGVTDWFSVREHRRPIHQRSGGWRDRARSRDAEATGRATGRRYQEWLDDLMRAVRPPHSADHDRRRRRVG